MDNPTIKFLIHEKDLKKIQTFIHMTDQEISGFGLVKEVQDRGNAVNNHIMVDELIFPKQKNSGASTLADEGVMIDLLQSLPPDKQNRIGFWWHSHVNMGTFWSSTDHDNMSEWVISPYLVSVVFNKKGEYLSRYYQYAPVRHVCDDVDIIVIQDRDVIDYCEKEMTDKVEGWVDPWKEGGFYDRGMKRFEHRILKVLAPNKTVLSGSELIKAPVKKFPSIVYYERPITTRDSRPNQNALFNDDMGVDEGFLEIEDIKGFLEKINFKNPMDINDLKETAKIVYDMRKDPENCFHLFKGSFEDEKNLNSLFITQFMQISKKKRDLEGMGAWAVEYVNSKLDCEFVGGEILFTRLEDSVVSLFLQEDLLDFLISQKENSEWLEELRAEHDNVVLAELDYGNFRTWTFGAKEKYQKLLKLDKEYPVPSDYGYPSNFNG